VAGTLAVSMSGWLNVLAAHAAAGGQKPKSCILIFLGGGPSHKDMFDMKPGTPDAGEFKPIDTSTPGIQITELLPHFAKQMHHVALLRNMTTNELDHSRARYHLHTGARPGAGGVVYPSIGAVAGSQLRDPAAELPNYVLLGGAAQGTGAGFLGAEHQPLVFSGGEKNGVVPNTKALNGDAQFEQQLDLLNELEQGFNQTRRSPLVNDHATTVQNAVKLMRSKSLKAFDISQEPEAVQQAYGNQFGRNCLTARRLVEAGVRFVELNAPGSWDTHLNNFTSLKTLVPAIDQGMSALIADLHSRGLLESTLVVVMGEFGRTPKINKNAGRDHYAKAWTTVLAGGGVKGGRVIGETDREGVEVVGPSVGVIDFLATICELLGIDYSRDHKIKPNGRPIALVDEKAKPVTALLR